MWRCNIAWCNYVRMEAYFLQIVNDEGKERRESDVVRKTGVGQGGFHYAATILLTTKMAAYGAVSVPGYGFNSRIENTYCPIPCAEPPTAR